MDIKKTFKKFSEYYKDTKRRKGTHYAVWQFVCLPLYWVAFTIAMAVFIVAKLVASFWLLVALRWKDVILYWSEDKFYSIR